MKTYIHYGSDTYNPELVSKAQPFVIMSKPDKGLWASPVDAEFGWAEWCELEDFDKSDFEKSFKFTLKPTAKILEIHKEEDIVPYVVFNSDINMFRRSGQLTDCSDMLNKIKLYSQFDGIELHISEDYERLHYGIFNTWDCDSICVWNPDVIELC